MSDATRALALSEANKALGPGAEPADVLKAAELFHAFVVADSAKPAAPAAPAAPVAQPPKSTSPPPAVKKPAAPAKPAAPKKPVKTEEQLAAEAIAAAEAEQAAADAEAEQSEGEGGATKEDVGNIVAEYLAAGRRAEITALLKKFKASSVSGVKAADYDAFVAEGRAALDESDPTA